MAYRNSYGSERMLRIFHHDVHDVDMAGVVDGHEARELVVVIQLFGVHA